MIRSFRKFFTAGLLVAYLQGGMALATITISQDGSWWSNLSSDQQVVAVEAEIDGYLFGYGDGFFHEGITLDVTKRDKVFASLKKNAPVFSRSFGYYQSAITSFYTIHPGASKLTVAEIIPCLADHAKISCEQIAHPGPIN